VDVSKGGQVFFKGEIITKMGWGHLNIFFLRTMKPEKLNFKLKLSYVYKGKLVKIMALEGRMGQIEMKCIFGIEKIFL
jgi:hypothetical protein